MINLSEQAEGAFINAIKLLTSGFKNTHQFFKQYFKANAASIAKPSPYTWSSLTPSQQTVCRKLVEKKYCHVENDHYVWDATNEEFGYLIHHGTLLLDNGKHPSSGRIQWKTFCPLFAITNKQKRQAQNAVSKLTHHQIRKGSSSYAKAENIRVLLTITIKSGKPKPKSGYLKKP